MHNVNAVNNDAVNNDAVNDNAFNNNVFNSNAFNNNAASNNAANNNAANNNAAGNVNAANNAANRDVFTTYKMENVKSPAQRRDVYRFWYEVYIEEMRRPIQSADHEQRLLVDDLEDHSIILAARSASGIIGTVRLNFPSAGPLSYFGDLYKIDQYEGYENRTVIVTRLMVAERFRKSSLGFRLSQESLLLALRAGVRDAYIDCNAHLIPHFRRLGFRDHVLAMHPDFGRVQVMHYDLSDHNRLAGLLGRSIAAAPNGLEMPQRLAS